MTEEEYFRKNYPDSCYGDKPLSPHWDFFQDGVEFSEQQSEKRIEELEKENAELKAKLNRYKHDCPNCSAFGKHCPHRVNGDPYTYDCYLTVAELEKENESLENVKNIYIGDLLKAKKIIKEFLGFAEVFGYSPSMDKFISETE